MTQDRGPYAAAWRRYRVWSGAFWILFLSFLPGVAAIARALRPVTDPSGFAIPAIAFVWMIVVAVAGYQKSNFLCPRCGKPFFRTFDDRPWRADWQRNPFARRCMHCGLPKWASRDPDGEAKSR